MLEKHGPGDQTPPELTIWSEDISNVKAVIRCDTLTDYPFAGILRTKSHGKYDRYLGVEDFHAFLADLSGQIILRQFETPFDTEVRKSRRYFQEVNAFLNFIEKHGERKWWDPDWKDDKGEEWKDGGSMKKMIAAYRSFRTWQNQFCKVLMKRYMVSESHDRSLSHSIIAGGTALLMAPDPDSLIVPDGRQDLLRNRLRHHLNSYRSDNQVMYDAYRHSLNNRKRSAFEENGLGSTLLARSIPGWSQVDEVWKAKPFTEPDDASESVPIGGLESSDSDDVAVAGVDAPEAVVVPVVHPGDAVGV
ncbi:MAG: hypothetical protein AAF492_27740, partial [Verrucomicrobiota bacterium]